MTTQSDYWCSRSLVITVEGPGGRQRVEVDKPFARLGSHDLSEVLIPDKGISRRRLYFHATDAGVFCVDLARSKSDTSPRGWLWADDCIKLGPYRIWAQLASPSASEVRPQRETRADLEAKETAAEPQPVLVMSINGQEIARRYLTRQLTVLGRRRPSTLRITSHLVSAPHCVLYWQSGVLWVVDLFSGNGTRLQGRLIDIARFAPGAPLKIGPAELHLVDMFEKLPEGTGQAGEIDDSSAKLAAQRKQFNAEVAAWNRCRQEAEAELAERTERLAAEQAEFDSRKIEWDRHQAERQKRAEELFKRQEEFLDRPEDAELQQSQRREEERHRIQAEQSGPNYTAPG